MSVKLQRLPIFGEGVFSRSPIVTRQRRLNCYLEIRKDAERSTILAYGTPGLALAFNASTPSQYPARGIIGNKTALYECAGNEFLSLSQAGATLFTGMLGSSQSNVSMALNPTQVIVVDGISGYIYTPGAATFAAIASAGFPNGAKTVTYCNGFFICELPGTNQFFVCNLNDGTTWNGLSYAAAVQYIDGILACDSLFGMLVIFSSGHLEFWQNVGAVPQPFQYITNSAAEYGLAAVYGRAHVGDSLVFVTQTLEGGIQIARIQGYQVSIISTTDIDNILQGMTTVADCTVVVYQVDEHKFAQFNFPTANRSLLWDATTGIWSEVQTGITGGYAARHLAQFAAVAFGQTYATDFSNGNVYNFSNSQYTDNGNTILRELVTRVVLRDFNAFQVGELYFDMQTGVGLQNPALQGYNPQVTIERAVDGRDFGPPRLIALGQAGQYITHVRCRRNGRSDGQGMIFRLRMSDPVPFVVTSGAAFIDTGVG
jgi:hypothetical protein